MAQPPKYAREKNFADDFGNETDHSALNAELDRASNSINDIRFNLAILQADDGRLRPDVVTHDSLSSDLIKGISRDVRADVQGELNRAEAAATQASESAGSAAIQADRAEDAAGRAEVAAGRAEVVAGGAIPDGSIITAKFADGAVTFPKLHPDVYTRKGGAESANKLLQLDNDGKIPESLFPESEIEQRLADLTNEVNNRVSKAGDTITGLTIFEHPNSSASNVSIRPSSIDGIPFMGVSFKIEAATEKVLRPLPEKGMNRFGLASNVYHWQVDSLGNFYVGDVNIWDLGAHGIGTMVFAFIWIDSSVPPGGLISGSSLRAVAHNTTLGNPNPTGYGPMSGTWRNISGANVNLNTWGTFQRVS